MCQCQNLAGSDGLSRYQYSVQPTMVLPDSCKACAWLPQVNGGVQLWCLQPCRSLTTSRATDQVAMVGFLQTWELRSVDRNGWSERWIRSTATNVLCEGRADKAIGRRRSLYSHQIARNAEQVEETAVHLSKWVGRWGRRRQRERIGCRVEMKQRVTGASIQQWNQSRTAPRDEGEGEGEGEADKRREVGPCLETTGKSYEGFFTTGDPSSRTWGWK